MGSWRDTPPRQLKKIVYAINDHNINKLIEDHENRGWEKASEVKEYGYGLGCLMVFTNKHKEDLNNARKTNNQPDCY